MKRILCACLLASLQSITVARAYEADIHYSATFALARAVGWYEADALTIASANQAVDENQETVAALEVDAIRHSSVAGYVASSFVVRIPEPRYPRLDSNASPYLVGADGSYQQVRGGEFAASLPSVHAHGIPGLVPNYETHGFKLQLSHWTQLLALPGVTQVALHSAGGREAR
jgi:hypothetical protein